MADSPIEKWILVSPTVEELTDASPVTTVTPADKLRTEGIELTVELQQFADKSEYAGLAVYQRALMITNDARDQFAVTFREAKEQKDGRPHERVTTGESVLFSNSPKIDLQSILDAKIAHDQIEIEDSMQNPELVAVNVSPKGGIYVFGVTPIRTEMEKILGGTGTDKKVRIASFDETMELLNGKDMEQNFVETIHKIA